MNEHLADSFTLNNGVKIPELGMGVFLIPDNATATVVEDGIKLGYRLIDTAQVYGNEEGTGEGIRRGLAATGLDRKDLFITTKVWNDHMSKEEAAQSVKDSLKKMQLDYFDMVLIHWPGTDQSYLDIWEALEDLYTAGLIRVIGVSNFTEENLENLLKNAKVVPAVNQVELHPYLNQRALREFHKDYHIHTEAWSPLAQGHLFDDPVLKDIAARHEKTVAQVVFRWDLQHDVTVLTKSVHEKRLIANADVFDFTLSDDDMMAIDELNKDHRYGPAPETYNFEL